MIQYLEMVGIRRTTVIILCLGAFLLGLASARFKFGFEIWWLAPAVALSVLSRRKSPKLFIVGIILVTFLTGWWRGAVYTQKLADYQPLFGKLITIEGTAGDDAVYAKQSQLGFTLTNATVIAPYEQQLVGQISAAGFGEHMIYRGDRVQVTGRLYPTRGSKQARLSFASLHTVQHHKSFIETIRHNFVAGIQTALPEPVASFALGLLIGQRSTLPIEVTAVLMAVGLTHIVAVSGYNLTILTDASQRLAGKRSRYQTTVISLSFVALFVLLVGSSPSITRAALVSTIGIIGWYFGRTVRPLLLILLVAALTAAYYPIYLWSDAGWYLSFLAFFGVLIVAPLVAKRISQPDKKPRAMTMLVIETMCAQLMTVPITLFIFGQTSAVALIANVLVVPFVPLAMLLSLFAGIGGMFVPAFSGLIAWPARILLTYMLDIATIFSRIPHVVIERSISPFQMIYMYGLVVVVASILWAKTRSKYAIIQDELNDENELR